ncbi:MAG: hypothetical protein JNJ50_08935 [Acidobacteria bacterium]|nr:hypothetical protein [Acidobacteriota bacterium]
MILGIQPDLNNGVLPNASAFDAQPTPWRFSVRSIAVRLFLTCWLVYGLHFATNIVREIYPALALGDHFSFRLDEYANLHPDLFEKPGYGWHINNNPGVSFVAAIPYAIARPVIDRVVARVQQQRLASGQEPPAYNSPWPMAQEFYKTSWQRGFDIKFGLAALVMQLFCMAPISALGVVAMFYALRQVFVSDRAACWLALLYAFGTPVFFRTGYLNHNLMLGHFLFMGFVAMWNPSGSTRWTTQTRFFLGGLTGGTAFFFDNSGAILLLALFAYGLAQRWRLTHSLTDVVRHGWWYFLGTLGPVGLLWFYQWKSFGHPLYPGQHWMPAVHWSEQGYQGLSLPRADLFFSQLFDSRYGLFVSCPLLLLALLAPWINRQRQGRLANFELWAMLGIFAALLLFCSGVHYSQLQFNTGVRYLAPIFPYLFIAAALVLMRLPAVVAYLIATLSVAEAWCMAMYRDVERGLGVLDPVLHVLLGGFQLPVLTTVSRLSGQFGELLSNGVSPLPLFALMGVILYGIWASFSWPAFGRAAKQAAQAGGQTS